MQPQQAPLIFTEAERPLGERLLKLALETDRVEGYTEPHAFMIARLAEAIGAQLGLHGTDLSALKFAALAHDIGERGMKRNYLLQPNILTWEETLDMWRHPILGEQSAAELQLPRQTQLLIRWHHEWWNGQGYPDSLAGTAIPLGARILRAVDTYCALISRRPHRQPFDLLDAELIIADLAGIELDPQIVKLLLALVVAERKQREAESWSSEYRAEPVPEPEPEFELRRARSAEEVFAPALAAQVEDDSEPEAPNYPSGADTLEMAPVVIEAQVAEALVESPDLPVVELPPAEPEAVSEEPDVSPDVLHEHEEAPADEQTTASEDQFSNPDLHSEETLSEETLSEETLSEETLSEETLSEETLSEETLKEAQPVAFSEPEVDDKLQPAPKDEN